MEELLVNGKPAVRINAKEVHSTEKAILLDCEGDEKWFPLSVVELEDGGTALIQEWLYDKEFGNE